jgi:type II secretory pathway component GspD/PulD (secretin)
VRALLTPTLFALENQEAEVLIADRLGYRVTTTINEVTTESVEFLESGVILRLTASVDRDDKILLKIHPEVSNGIVIDGLPNQTTTEVTTELLVDDGQSVFIGGLINDRATDSESGMPFVRKIPILGHLVSKEEAITSATETVVVVTAHLVDRLGPSQQLSEEKIQRIPEVERQLRERAEAIDQEFEPEPAAPDPTAGP